MLYLLDTANLKAIEKAYDLYPMNGVTTNPTIISKEKNRFLYLLKDIRKIIGNDSMLHVQAVSLNSKEIINEALYLNEVIGGNLYIKIPVIPQGIKAIKTLKEKDIKVTATAIFTAQQALMAAQAGAEFVAPYVNRIDNISGNGINVVEEIVKLFKIHNINSKVLSASFKNVQQVHSVSLMGSHAVTVNPEILDKMLEHPLTNWSVEQFTKDWENTYGKDTNTMTLK